MPKFSRGVLRLFGVVALVVLLAPVVTTLVDAAAGRDFPRCIQQCNFIRGACNDRCSTDCTALFPGSANKPARDACIADCKAGCVDESNDCKLVCKAIKDGETIEEP